MNASSRFRWVGITSWVRTAAGVCLLAGGLAAPGCTHSKPATRQDNAPDFLARTDEIFGFYKAHDLKKLLDTYTPDALCLFFDQPWRFDIGRPAIEARMRAFFGSIREGDIKPAKDIRVDRARDRAWTTRFVKASLVLKSGTKYDFDGWHSAVWVRRDKVWLIEYEHIGGRLKTTEPPAAPVLNLATGLMPRPILPVFVTIELKDIFFDFDLWNIRPDQVDTLEYNAKILRENPDVQVIIEGHCDERGTLDYNVGLGQRRADSTKQAMIELGIDPARMSTVSVGKEPVFEPGHGEPIWGRNRRSHFVIVKP
jgi:peptidoglycan-associated lipoprotein